MLHRGHGPREQFSRFICSLGDEITAPETDGFTVSSAWGTAVKIADGQGPNDYHDRFSLTKLCSSCGKVYREDVLMYNNSIIHFWSDQSCRCLFVIDFTHPWRAWVALEIQSRWAGNNNSWFQSKSCLWTEFDQPGKTSSSVNSGSDASKQTDWWCYNRTCTIISLHIKWINGSEIDDTGEIEKNIEMYWQKRNGNISQNELREGIMFKPKAVTAQI